MRVAAVVSKPTSDKDKAMQRTSVERVTIVHEIFCDRCGLRARRAAEGSDFRRMTSIGFKAEEGSIFGQGQRVEIDLCERCLRDALGHWLRVRTLTDGEVGADLAADLIAIDPERHVGEFPLQDPQSPGAVAESGGFAELADPVEGAAEAPTPDRTTAFPDSWVPVGELFNRLADGATLEQILEAFPQISRHGASNALREAALRFPSYACFHPAVDVWSPRFPHEW
jgi:hypothetical protein